MTRPIDSDDVLSTERERVTEHGSITLKWGTLKGWKVTTDRSRELLKRYHDIGACVSVMAQRDTPEQKQIICDLIDDCDDPQGIYLDWDGECVSKDAAKDYINNYRRAP